jgi:gluconate 2-dehydrogenase gamma chain
MEKRGFQRIEGHISGKKGEKIMKRREFILIPAKALGGAVLYSLVGGLIRADAQGDGEEMVKVPLRFFTAEEAKIVQAAAARIIPTDDSGPGATEAGVVIYIDRQLASGYGRDKYRYTKGPWVEANEMIFGYQGKDTPQDTYHAGIPLMGKDFAGLSPEEQDQRLEKMERTRFFQMFREHCVEGFMCDPMHKGNKNMVGWKLIGYPGPRLSYIGEMTPNYGKPYRVAPQSLSQILGHDVTPVEDQADPVL